MSMQKLQVFFHVYKKWNLLFIACLTCVALLACISFSFKDTKLYSRKVMEYAEYLVAHDMSFSPPQAALIYAHISTLYYKVLLREGRPGPAVIASVRLLDFIYPEQKIKNKGFLTSLSLEDSNSFSSSTLKLIISTKSLYAEQTKKRTPYKRPQGKDYWNGESPLGVEAMNWSKWIIDSNFDSEVPPPPQEGGEEQKQAIEELIAKTNDRTAEQGAYINFWSGMHMSPAVAGIWQDRLYQVVRAYLISDKQYAYAQMILAQAISDTYIEVWKVKYTYWTKRPSRYSSSIDSSMVDPNYPSYVSEYSTVAVVASQVLTTMFPDGGDVWLKQDAPEASIVGILAGCSFPYDEIVGAKLGASLAYKIITNLELTPIVRSSFIPVKFLTPKSFIYDRREDTY